MKNDLGLQLAILERMDRPYVTALLAEAGLSEADALRLRERCTWRLPEQLVEFVRRAPLFTSSSPTERLDSAPDQEDDGLRRRRHLLSLWPHLYWTVEVNADGAVCDVGFRNQAPLSFGEVDPATIRRGVWTRSSLQLLYREHELWDDWNERVVVRFRHRDQQYEGEFVFHLLQRWSRV